MMSLFVWTAGSLLAAISSANLWSLRSVAFERERLLGEKHS